MEIIDWALLVVFLSFIATAAYAHWSDMRRMKKRSEQFKRLAEFWRQQDDKGAKR